MIYETEGRWIAAEEPEIQLLEKSERDLGEEHILTVTSSCSLSLIYWNPGKWKEPAELDLQVWGAMRII